MYVMRRRKVLIVTLLLLVGVMAVVLGVHSRSPLFVVVAEQSLDANHRLVSIRTRTGWLGRCYSSDRFQARLRGRWTEPQEIFQGCVCVVPTEADACRFFVQEYRGSRSQRAEQLMDRCGVAERAPRLYRWVIRHLSDKMPPVRHFTVEMSLPKRAHNKSVQATAAACFRFLAFVVFIYPSCRPQSLSAAVPDLWRSDE